MQVKSIAECSMGSISAILLTFIKQPFVIKIFVLSFFEWPFYTGFTVCSTCIVCTTCINALCIKSTAFKHVYVLNTNTFKNIFRPKHTECLHIELLLLQEKKCKPKST